MKKFIAIIIVAAALAAVTATAQPQPIYGYVAQPAITTGITNQNGTKGASGVYWTNGIAAAWTNVTQVNQVGTKDTAFQFQSNIQATNNGSVTVIWQLARSVSGASTTNQTGVPGMLDLFCTVTNTIAVNTTASPTLTFNMSTIAPNAAPAGVGPASELSDGAFPYIYVYSVTPSAGVLTNCSVYTAGQ